MPSHRDFECWIQCGNERLEEYSSSFDGEGNAVCCWIPSVAGMSFAVHYRNLRVSCTIDFQCTVYVDGTCMRSLLGSASHGREELCDGARVDWKIVRPFVFSSIDVTGKFEFMSWNNVQAGSENDERFTDDESLATFKPDPMFGTIEVRFHLVVQDGCIPWKGSELEV